MITIQTKASVVEQHVQKNGKVTTSFVLRVPSGKRANSALVVGRKKFPFRAQGAFVVNVGTSIAGGQIVEGKKYNVTIKEVK